MVVVEYMFVLIAIFFSSKLCELAYFSINLGVSEKSKFFLHPPHLTLLFTFLINNNATFYKKNTEKINSFTIINLAIIDCSLYYKLCSVRYNLKFELILFCT